MFHFHFHSCHPAEVESLDLQICQQINLPELETELVVEVEWEWSIAGEVDVDELVLVPSSVVFLKKLCCRA